MTLENTVEKKKCPEVSGFPAVCNPLCTHLLCMSLVLMIYLLQAANVYASIAPFENPFPRLKHSNA